MKKVAIMLGEGFEEIEALTTVDVLRRAKIECDLVSVKEEYVKGAHNVVVKADKVVQKDLIDYDMIVCPGGMPGAENLANCEILIDTIKEFNNNDNKYIAAICASPAVVLSKAGITNDRYVTSYPGEEFEGVLEDSNYVEELVVVDGNLITSRGPATTLLFAYKLVDILGGSSENLKSGMLWNMLEEEKE